MKTTSRNISYILLFIFAGLSFSCGSSDDDSSTGAANTNLMPGDAGDYWTYDVTISGLLEDANSETVTVDGTTVINGNTYTDMSASVGSIGIMSQIFDLNYFRSQNDVYYINGELSIPLSQFGGTDLAIGLADEVLIDRSQNAGTTLSEETGTQTQDIAGYPMTISYSMRTVQQGELASYTVNGDNFSSVVKADIIVSLSMSTTVEVFGIPVTVPILAEQDIYTIENYYAENIGMIQSTATFAYEIADLSAAGITLPFPTTGEIITLQNIADYSVN